MKVYLFIFYLGQTQVKSWVSFISELLSAQKLNPNQTSIVVLNAHVWKKWIKNSLGFEISKNIFSTIENILPLLLAQLKVLLVFIFERAHFKTTGVDIES